MRTTFYAVLIGLFVYLLNDYQGIPVPVLIVVVMALIFTGLATKTRFGRYVYAIGGNSEAARLSGINIRRNVLAVFALSGLMAALGGILLTARLNAASVAAGQMAELDAIAACVIGGTSLMGGTGSIGGAIIGALVMASLDNGLSMMNTPPFWQFIVKGLILVLAVWIDIATKTRAQN
jgi:D-xylose transport system permease protein